MILFDEFKKGLEEELSSKVKKSFKKGLFFNKEKIKGKHLLGLSVLGGLGYLGYKTYKLLSSDYVKKAIGLWDYLKYVKTDMNFESEDDIKKIIFSSLFLFKGGFILNSQMQELQASLTLTELTRTNFLASLRHIYLTSNNEFNQKVNQYLDKYENSSFYFPVYEQKLFPYKSLNYMTIATSVLEKVVTGKDRFFGGVIFDDFKINGVDVDKSEIDFFNNALLFQIIMSANNFSPMNYLDNKSDYKVEFSSRSN